ncbi:MAG: 5-formyltetrahydrofolate cyclo-ligase [Atopostipes suicloacalis]|nr:5-formyltetrahydrofolate cyclo-ligase [Atopostipes suicloacalis]
MVKSKESLRQLMQEKLAKLSEKERQNISRKMQDELFKLPSFKNAEVIGIYLSFGTEWDTRNIIKNAWDAGKKVVIPKTVPETKAMNFYQINNYSEVKKGHFGLEEPIVEKTIYTKKENIDFLLVPGLIFSKEGYRIGFGGGYYDRYLADFSNSTLSLVWTKQLVENLPINKYDIAVDHLLTEDGRIN